MQSTARALPRLDPARSCYRLRIAPSGIHRFGVFAAEDIPPRRKVIEYTGERINRRETKRRSQHARYIYLFTLNEYWTLDGAVGGSGAEYINHSCSPNIYSWIARGHILYMSKRPIRCGEELTVDYRFGKNVERVRCVCGSENCRGTINLVD